jgi:TolB-like protein/Tfp pilus assembly protein PilF
MDSRNFFAELKRRNVYKVAIAYAVVAWLLMQIASQIFPFFEIPNWAVRLVVLLLVIGFPVAVILAWAFELTPEGIKRAEDVDLSPTLTRKTGRKLDFFIIAVLLLVIATLIFQRLRPNVSPAISSSLEKSIAVLPFQNLSKDEENAFFADGVQDQILTDLAKVADLKVISRTSVMQYKNVATRNLREIAQQLGVAHVLEGSVQRAGGKVRVSAQLINARTDGHEWAENYDRPIDDVFAIQSEIAKAIAEQLQAQISPREKAAMSQVPTTDLEANQLFLQAKGIEEVSTNDPNGKQNLLRAERLLNEAVRRDPKFLVAHCLLSRVHMDLYFEGFDHTSMRLELGKAALDNAASIQPDAGEVHLARVEYLYQGFRDYDAARAEVELARRTLPNHADIPYYTGLMDRRQARWVEAEHNFARTLELDPRNVSVLFDIADFYRALRRYSESSAYFERILTISPQEHYYRTQIGQNAFFSRADLQSWRTQLATLLREEPDAAGDIVSALFWCALAERDSAAIARAVSAISPEGLQDQRDILSFWPREWYVGLADRVLGNTAGAQAAFAAARVTVEKTLHDQPDYASAWAQLALLDAGLGRKNDAIREGRRACELLPLSRDTLIAPSFIINLAMVYAWTGEKDLALEQLGMAAQIPNGVTYGELKLYPQWDSLRGDPRFEKIVASLAPKESSPQAR